ncbi:MAG TPA: hypothetical protein VF532_03485 [Candidatus Angelobacter sp.]
MEKDGILAEATVYCESFSASESLLTAKNTGIFTKFGLRIQAGPTAFCHIQMGFTHTKSSDEAEGRTGNQMGHFREGNREISLTGFSGRMHQIIITYMLFGFPAPQVN